MDCEFCEKIIDINDVDKLMQHSECCLFKDSVTNVGIGIYIGDELYGMAINYCPICGRKLTGEEE